MSVTKPVDWHTVDVNVSSFAVVVVAVRADSGAGAMAPPPMNTVGARVSRRNDPHASEHIPSTTWKLRPQSAIVGELQELVHFTSSLETRQIPGGVGGLELSTIESRVWLESEGWSYSPKSK
jgi:hypothetical protein